MHRSLAWRWAAPPPAAISAAAPWLRGRAVLRAPLRSAPPHAPHRTARRGGRCSRCCRQRSAGPAAAEPPAARGAAGGERQRERGRRRTPRRRCRDRPARLPHGRGLQGRPGAGEVPVGGGGRRRSGQVGAHHPVHPGEGPRRPGGSAPPAGAWALPGAGGVGTGASAAGGSSRRRRGMLPAGQREARGGEAVVWPWGARGGGGRAGASPREDSGGREGVAAAPGPPGAAAGVGFAGRARCAAGPPRRWNLRLRCRGRGPAPRSAREAAGAVGSLSPGAVTLGVRLRNSCPRLSILCWPGKGPGSSAASPERSGVRGGARCTSWDQTAPTAHRPSERLLLILQLGDNWSFSSIHFR